MLILKQLEASLAWLWVLCAVLTVLDLVSPLQFANRTLASGAHWIVWLLAFTATRYFHLVGPLPWLLWGAMLAVGALWVLSFFLGIIGLLTQLPGQYVYAFFTDTGDESLLRWKTIYVDARRGRALVANQYFVPLTGNSNGYRKVRIMPLTPLLQWVRVLPADQLAILDAAQLVRQGWTPVNRTFANFSFDPAEQRRLDEAQARKEAQELHDRQVYEASPLGRANAKMARHIKESNNQ